MEAEKPDDVRSVTPEEVKQEEMGGSELKGMEGVGTKSSKNMYLRADKFDMKSLDIQLEKHMSRVWSKNIKKQRPKEEWEIDLSKLVIGSVIAHGTYGVVYKGTYDAQVVAGNNHHMFCFPLLQYVFQCFTMECYTDMLRYNFIIICCLLVL